MSTLMKTARTVIFTIVGIGVLIVIIAWLSGYFESRIEPGREETVAAAVGGPVVEVEVRSVPKIVRAVGTVRAVHETAVGSRLLSHVRAVHVTAGQSVSSGDVLVELDKADLEAKLQQSRASLDAATARLTKARSDLEKITTLSDRGAATQQELSDARRAAEVAHADADGARQTIAEAQAQLEYATIRSPIKGIVIDKLVEEGDLARPGQMLVTLYEPDRLQLVAAVPERLALGLSIGDLVGVELQALDLQCQGQISEIVPQASPASRSLLVKVTGPCPPGVMTGMFGRLLIEDGRREQLLVPATAVRTIGQLQLVQVVSGAHEATGTPPARTERRFVRTGPAVNGSVEVLAGLAPGEKVLAHFPTPETGRVPDEG